jgi:uncharacterized protein
MTQTPIWMTMADPIHGMIRLNRRNPIHRLLLEVINSRAFQRLRRIKQMGLAEFVFPGATHSRFVHSIGAMWLMEKALEVWRQTPELKAILDQPFEDTELSIETLLMLSILVHDIGHTPLSHTLEDVLNLKETGLLHDEYWNRLIFEHDPELAQIWKRFGEKIPQALARFNGWGIDEAPHFLAAMVSGQLDMDRLDYLLRDSHNLGVQYGRIEVERIITNLVLATTDLDKPVIAIREEALPAVEHYLFGRFQAYKMALHSLDKASETNLKKTLERFLWVRQQGLNPGNNADILYQLMTTPETLSVEDYLIFDDCYLWDKINLWARYSEDELLKTLALRLLGHDLFKFVELTDFVEHPSEEFITQVETALKQHYAERKLNWEICYEFMSLLPKPLYQSAPIKPPVWVRRRNGKVVDFSEVTSLPLTLEPDRGKRVIMFVWDKAAQQFLNHTLRTLTQ